MKLYLVVLLLAGCASTESVWVQAGASDQQFYMDRGQCQAQAFAVPVASTTQTVLVFNSCMAGKGWRTEEREIRR